MCAEFDALPRHAAVARMQQQSAITGDPTFLWALSGALSLTFLRLYEEHVVEIQLHARRLPLPARAAVVRRDDRSFRPDGPAVLSVDEVNGAQSLCDIRRFFIPGHPTVNGPQQFSACPRQPGMFGVNRGHVVKQFARGGLLYQPCGAAIFRVLNHSRLADRPTDLIVRKGHPQEDRIGKAQTRFHSVRTFVLVPARRTLRLPGLSTRPGLLNRQTSQRSRFPVRAAIIASQKKDALAPIKLVAAVEQSVFTQQQSAI